MIDADGTKKCATCGERKLAAKHFYSCSHHRDDFDSNCKECEARRAKDRLARAKANPPVVDMDATSECTICRQVKRHAEFAKDKRRPSGVSSHCRACVAERTRGPSLARWRANKEARKATLNAKRKTPEYKAKRSVYRKRPDVRAVELDRNRLRKGMIRQTQYDLATGNKARELSIEGKFTRADWLALLKEFEHSCTYCGTETKLTMEHLTPLSRKGKNEVGNIVPACLPCNASKRDKTVEEFMPERAAGIRQRALLN